MVAIDDSMCGLPTVSRYMRLEKPVVIPDYFDSKRFDAHRSYIIRYFPYVGGRYLKLDHKRETDGSRTILKVYRRAANSVDRRSSTALVRASLTVISWRVGKEVRSKNSESAVYSTAQS